jgi:hypothetical protein
MVSIRVEVEEKEETAGERGIERFAVLQTLELGVEILSRSCQGT